MTNVISGKSVNLSAHQCFHLCKGALGLVMPNFPSSLGAPANGLDFQRCSNLDYLFTKSFHLDKEFSNLAPHRITLVAFELLSA